MIHRRDIYWILAAIFLLLPWPTHSYVAGPNVICPATLHCSHSDIASAIAISGNSIPGNTGTKPVVNGGTYIVRLFGIPVGTVRSHVDVDRLTVLNTTHPSHVLYNGWIDRVAVNIDGTWYAITRGHGHSFYGGAVGALINHISGPHIFGNLDAVLRSRIEAKFHTAARPPAK